MMHDEYGKNIDLYKEVHKFLEMKYTGASIAELQVQFMHIKKLAGENEKKLSNYIKNIDYMYFNNGKSNVGREVNKILSSASNPLTYELCEAMLEKFLSPNDVHAFSVRNVYLPSDHYRKRIPDAVRDEAQKKLLEFENKAMEEGVNLLLERGTIPVEFLDAAEKFLRERYGDEESKLQFSYSNKKAVIKMQLSNFLNDRIVDEKFQGLFKKIKNQNYDFTFDHCCSINSDRVKFYPTFRIYLNASPNCEYVEFIYKYVCECQKYGINYDMKAFFNFDFKHGNNTKDRAIIYINYFEFPKHIEILEKLFKEYSKDGILGGELGLGSPPSATAQIPSLPGLGICYTPIDLEMACFSCNIAYYTSNDYFDSLCLRALYSMFNGSNYEKNRYYGFNLSKEEKLKLYEKLSVLWNDPLKRKVIINTFMNCIQDEHDNIVGKKNSNIAVDFYTTAFTDSNVNKLDDDYKVSSGLKK